MEEVREQWWDLAWKLVAKYQSGYNVTEESSAGTKATGYGEWWLNHTEWIEWPPTNSYKPPAGADKTWDSIVVCMAFGRLACSASCRAWSQPCVLNCCISYPALGGCNCLGSA